MATDNPFAIDPASETMDEPGAQRRKRIQSLSALGGLGQYANEEQAGLQEQPLYEGETSKNVASPEAQEPSQLATERVQRAPSSENAQPLLGESERLGNVLSGEEGTYKPLSGPQRSLSLKDFFQGAGGNAGGAGAEQGGGASGGGVSNDVGGSGQQAGQAIGYSKQANQVGTGLGKRLAQLFQGAGAAGGAGTSFPAGLSLYGSGAPGAQFGSGLSLSGGTEAAGGLNPSDYTGAFGSQEGLGGTSGAYGDMAGGLGSTIGQVGAGVGGALTLAGLINSLVSGQTDTSQTGAIPRAGLGLLSSALPIAQSLIGPAAAGASGGLGLSGLGLAYTPLLIKSIVDMIKGPSDLPYSSGQNISLARTRGAAAEIPGQLNQYLLGQNNPLSLIGLATGAQPLSPNNEVQFYSGDAPWQTDYYNNQLQGLLSGDPQSTQDFLRNVQIRAGGTGEANPVSEQVTDTYRRQLAHSLGLSPEQTAGMFGEDQFSGGLNEAFWNEVASTPYGGAGDSGVGKLQELMGQANQYGDPNYSGNFANYSPNYRDPAAGRLSPEQVNIFQQLLQEKLGQAQAQQKQYGQGGE